MNDEGVVAEISRPDDSSNYRQFFRSHPVMVTAQLFYDASHRPGGVLNRASVWEVHPVYSIWVRQETTLNACPPAKPDDKAFWIPFS